MFHGGGSGIPTLLVEGTYFSISGCVPCVLLGRFGAISGGTKKGSIRSLFSEAQTIAKQIVL